MTTSTYDPVSILLTYPKTNPYDLDPPPFNLIPQPDPAVTFLTPELKAAALAVAQRTAVNVFYKINGQYPFALGNADRDRVYKEQTPFVEYRKPPPLQQESLPDDVRFLERINEHGHTPVFVVEVEGQRRLLKIYPDREAHTDEPYYKTKQVVPDPRDLFDRETEAYAHLLHYGACEKGVVPVCYGWVVLSPQHVESIASIADEIADEYKYDLENDVPPPRGILLEYFHDAQQLSIENVSMAIAEKALRALHPIHAAYVRHGDVHGRNILLLPDERVVWIDFNNSMCASDEDLTRHDLFEELHDGWYYFYRGLLPDQMIDFVQWVG